MIQIYSSSLASNSWSSIYRAFCVSIDPLKNKKRSRRSTYFTPVRLDDGVISIERKKKYIYIGRLLFDSLFFLFLFVEYRNSMYILRPGSHRSDGIWGGGGREIRNKAAVTALWPSMTWVSMGLDFNCSNAAAGACIYRKKTRSNRGLIRCSI